ncbi:MAG: hypothetical protein ACR2JC_07145 [Chloroflexota bacterium]
MRCLTQGALERGERPRGGPVPVRLPPDLPQDALLLDLGVPLAGRGTTSLAKQPNQRYNLANFRGFSPFSPREDRPVYCSSCYDLVRSQGMSAGA